MNTDGIAEMKEAIRSFLTSVPERRRSYWLQRPLAMMDAVKKMIERKARREKADARKQQLKERNERAYQMRMGGMSYSEIGRKLGVSGSRASQLCWRFEKDAGRALRLAEKEAEREREHRRVSMLVSAERMRREHYPRSQIASMIQLPNWVYFKALWDAFPEMRWNAGDVPSVHGKGARGSK